MKAFPSQMLHKTVFWAVFIYYFNHSRIVTEHHHLVPGTSGWPIASKQLPLARSLRMKFSCPGVREPFIIIKSFKINRWSNISEELQRIRWCHDKRKKSQIKSRHLVSDRISQYQQASTQNRVPVRNNAHSKTSDDPTETKEPFFF